MDTVVNTFNNSQESHWLDLESTTLGVINQDDVDTSVDKSTSSDSNYYSGGEGSGTDISPKGTTAKRAKVVCPRPEDDYAELGFLADLPAYVNIILKPSSVKVQRQPSDSPYLNAFKKFLNGDLPTAEGEASFPGKMKYTPRSLNNLTTINSFPAVVNIGAPASASGVKLSDGIATDKSAKTSPDILGSQTPKTASKVDRTSSLKSRSTLSNSEVVKDDGMPNRNPVQSMSKRSKLSSFECDDDENYVDFQAAPPPKREHTKRKAKDEWSNKLGASKKCYEVIDVDDEGTDDSLKLDSDNDATGKPEKNKESSSLSIPRDHQKVRPTSDSGKSPEFSKSTKQATVLYRTALVLDDEEFKIGDFVVLKEDIGKDTMCLWKLDTDTLMQKFLQNSADKAVYKAANLFSGVVPWMRKMYSSVSVDCLSDDLVKIVKISGSRNPGVRRKESIKETKESYDSFEIYLQALISQSLDSNFLAEIYRDNDEYFVSNINKIDGINEVRKNKLLSRVSWSQTFENALNTCPLMKKPAESALRKKCEACTDKISNTMIVLQGEKYDKTTLKSSPDGSPLFRTFNVCKPCSKVGRVSHTLSHMKNNFKTICSMIVRDMKARCPDMLASAILTKIIEKDSWVEKQFKRAQEIWACADAFD